jgi:hypothetical protein
LSELQQCLRRLALSSPKRTAGCPLRWSKLGGEPSSALTLVTTNASIQHPHIEAPLSAGPTPGFSAEFSPPLVPSDLYIPPSMDGRAQPGN